MSKRTLVGSFDYAAMRATGLLGYADHVIFAYEGKEQKEA